MSSSRPTNRLLFSAALLAFSGLISSFNANASTPKAAPPPIDDRILVSAVDVPNQQLTITYQRDKTKHVYVVDGMTTVKAQGNIGTLKDLKVGQQVYNYTERDDKSLDSIEVAVAQQAPVAPKKKK